MRVTLEKQIERFWEKVDTSAGPDSCWNWRNSTFQVSGYGQATTICRIAGSPKSGMTSAHRQAWLITHGDPGTYVDEKSGKTLKYEVRHMCPTGPNKLCCNPKHLKIGTAQENTNDKFLHGTIMRGTQCHRAKFDPESIRTVRYLYDNKIATALDLRRAYNVSVSCIYSIVSRNKWKHVK